MEISGYLVLLFFILPLILWVAVWGLFTLAYPFMFLYGALTSSASRKRWKDDILRREKDTIEKVGRDLLSMDKIRIPLGSSNPEVIWASIVIGTPSSNAAGVNGLVGLVEDGTTFGQPLTARISGACPPPAPSVWYIWMVRPATAAMVSS